MQSFATFLDFISAHIDCITFFDCCLDKNGYLKIDVAYFPEFSSVTDINALTVTNTIQLSFHSQQH